MQDRSARPDRSAAAQDIGTQDEKAAPFGGRLDVFDRCAMSRLPIRLPEPVRWIEAYSGRSDAETSCSCR